MGSRWFSVAVVGLWLLSMGWLVTEKVLPPLLLGNPPNYLTILNQQEKQPPVGWNVLLGGKPVGWAVTTADRPTGEMYDVRCRTHFDRVPLDEIMPEWLRKLIPRTSRLDVDTESRVSIDPLGQLSSFDSMVHVGTWRNAINVYGAVEANMLNVTVRYGDFSYRRAIRLPPNALLGDSLSPQACLPGLRAGQTWTVPSFSALRPPESPMEILQATVEGKDVIPWDGGLENVWLVVFRADSGAELSRDRAPRSRLWVRSDGTVLQQEMALFDASLTFVRMPDRRAASLAAKYLPLRRVSP